MTGDPEKPEGSSFSSSVEDRHFEDYVAEAVREFSPITAEENEMIVFARRSHPQPSFTDPEAAKQSEFGGLIESAWYTSS